MNKSKVTKVLIIISILIMIFGIIVSISFSLGLRNTTMPEGNVYFEGRDTTKTAIAFVNIMSIIIAVGLCVRFLIFIIIIWIIYGIIILIKTKLIKSKEKNN